MLLRELLYSHSRRTAFSYYKQSHKHIDAILFERKYSLFARQKQDYNRVCFIISLKFFINHLYTVQTKVYIYLQIFSFYMYILFPFAFYLYRSFQLSIKMENIYIYILYVYVRGAVVMFCISSPCMRAYAAANTKAFWPKQLYFSTNFSFVATRQPIRSLVVPSRSFALAVQFSLHIHTQPSLCVLCSINILQPPS